VEEINKLLDSKEESATLTLLRDKIGIEIGSATLIAKLLTGPYPDYSRVIPSKSSTPLKLHREELIALLRQVSLFTSEASSGVRFSFAEGLLHLSAMSGEIGEGKVRMPVNYAGPKLEMAFNPECFLAILRHSKDEIVYFNVSEPYSPGLITDSSRAEFVIMPMRM
jgi:DNA polymerase-3 subunit beta